MFWKKQSPIEKFIQNLKERQRTILWIVLLGISIILFIWILGQKQSLFGLVGSGFIILLCLLQLLQTLSKKQDGKKHKAVKQTIRKPEEKDGELLADLSGDYYVLSDVKSPQGVISRVVIGKNTGVFLIDIRADDGKVTVEGDKLRVNGKTPEEDPVARALQKTGWLKNEIAPLVGTEPWITPVIVFTGASVPPTKPVKGVHILHKKYLPDTLQRASKHETFNAAVWEQKEAIKNRLG